MSLMEKILVAEGMGADTAGAAICERWAAKRRAGSRAE